MTPEQTKAVEKIKRLLELAASPVPAEAALAFSKAQLLMAKYSIAASELGENKVEDIIRVEYSPKVRAIGLVDQLPYIAQAIGTPFGVFVVVRSSERKVLLVGFQTNVTLVTYAIDCVLTQCIHDYRIGFAKQRSIAFATEFWAGVASALETRFSASQKSDSTGTAIAVYDKVKEFMKQFQPGNWATAQSDLSGARSAGMEAGQNATIRPAVQTASGGKLLN